MRFIFKLLIKLHNKFNECGQRTVQPLISISFTNAMKNSLKRGNPWWNTNDVNFFFYCCILSCRPEIPPFLINNFSISVWPVGKIFIFSRFERFFGNQTFFSHFWIICFYRVLWLCPALLNQIDSQHWCLPDFELTIARHLCDLKEF